ncbi:MAG: sulfatase-like hydrolase/transferase [Pirellulaceae bacterium]|nr:sulfatase-like hydrolase/transferase [Pirellulaceae bacterium]
MTPARGDDAPPRPPNFVVIMADDLSASELGCYGHPTQRTPNLDRLAEHGVKFETAFACPVCHPTRFMIMTGQYGARNGVYNFAGSRGGPPEKHAGVDDIAKHLTFSKLLKDAGYTTAMVGKWQLSGRPPGLIRECGFDEYCCWAFGEYYSDDQRRLARQAGVQFRSRYWHPSIIRNGKWVPTTVDDYGPDIFAKFVVEFIQRNRQHPFLIYYPMALTHSPWVATPDSLRTENEKFDKDKRHFSANVEYADKIVGRIVDALRTHALQENTMVIFTGDNGSGRGGKSEPTERGARVPLIIDGPGIVKTRGSTMELSDLSDILPTLADFAGIDLPPQHPIDGVSLAPFLTGQTETTRPWIFSYQADRRILRTQRWLLEDNSPLRPGRLYDCGNYRDGQGYLEVTDSTDPQVTVARQFFDQLLANLPAPVLLADGPPNERKSGQDDD